MSVQSIVALYLVVYVAEPWAEVGVDTLMERMKSLAERTQEECSESEMAKRFERVENQSAELLPVAPPLPLADGSSDKCCAIGQFVDDPGFLYEDFARRSDASVIPTFRVQVCSILLHCIPLLLHF